MITDPDVPQPIPASNPGDLADGAVAMVAQWLRRADAATDRAEAKESDRLSDLIDDPAAVAFTMRFVDRVARPESDRAAAHQLTRLVSDHPLPDFLSPIDRTLLRAGALLAPRLPRVVMPLARRRMRDLVGHLVADVETKPLGRHLEQRSDDGYALNVNLLGEAILGEEEAESRFQRTLELIADPKISYVSVKVSAIASQLDLWAYDHTLDRITARLAELYDAAERGPEPTFVNLDMEEYKDLRLTVDAFTRLLDERPQLDAGIVLQAYLPDTYGVLQELVTWANQRPGTIKIRLVKGANLAMEQVDAELHGWCQAPYATKVESDANFKRCLDWVLTPERTAKVRIGVGSHNLFDVAWTHLLAQDRAVADRVEFEMLQGMAPAQAEVVRDDTGSMLLYTPVVARTDFDVAIGYLFRRLEENASSDNFLRHLFSLRPGSPEFVDQERVFRHSLALRHTVGDQPRRTQDRTAPPVPVPDTAPFANEADTDPVLEANRRWADAARSTEPGPVVTPLTTDEAGVDSVVATAVQGARSWSALSAVERRTRLRAVAEVLAAKRGELLSAMIHEGAKTVEQADPEISEAIDFARWYADRALDTTDGDGATFTPLGVILVVPPWNFPVAIPAGGVLAALAAGNAVVAKPAPETPRCFELVIEACWEAGIPTDALQFIRTPDDDVGRRLVTHPDIDGVILTGAWETANLFRSWKPDLALYAETSGKNALIVTPQADLDLAAADLVRSAFGHSGQKCSAASLGILVGEVADSPRFRRQLLDAARSLTVGPTTDPATVMGPVIREPEGPLARALAGDVTDTGTGWLLEPRALDDSGRLWSPGIIDGVGPGSWFHRTECFGPVLGLLAARDLDHAIELQNQVAYGLTGGIHTLDPHEVEQWTEQVEVGNAYVNRHITGAIVRRQPFGGWKRSAIGAGAKAGGPNYVTQLGTWHDDGVPRLGQAPGHQVRGMTDRILAAVADSELTAADRAWLESAVASDAYWWDREFGPERDESGLRMESNVFRYRHRPGTVIRIDAGAEVRHAIRTVLAAELARSSGRPADPGPIQVSLGGTPPVWLTALAPGVEVRVEDEGALLARMEPWTRIRLVGNPSADLLATAHKAEVDVAAVPVVADGRRELLHYLREQAVSRTLHRFGNLIAD